MASSVRESAVKRIEKCPTGIQGLDDVLEGGLPKGRPTLVCGSAGCGKTLLSIEFLVRGAIQFGEPGVFLAFEETPQELAKNVASLGFDLQTLIDEKKLYVDYVQIERTEIEETGEYDLEGIFVRLGYAIDAIGAKRVALDTLEVLFGALSNQAVLRSELRRLFRWLKDRGVTAVVTAERGSGQLTRHGFEEYVSDCVILLDHRVTEEVSTRRLRVVKYRGSVHGTNEYPFVIDDGGFSVFPLTSLRLQHAASSERIPSGIPELDEMLGGKGCYRGTSILVTGMAGTGKSSLAASFVDAACERGERALYFAMEESPSQIVRNMRSIGLDLQRWVDAGLLSIHASRPTMHGIETHQAIVHKTIARERPAVVVMDPITNFITVGDDRQVRGMLTRIVDLLKGNGITAMFTSLTHGGTPNQVSDVGVSSLMDTWLLLRNLEISGERNRALNVIKSRGMAHSNQVREFVLSDDGVQLRDVYLGPAGMLTGSARAAQEAQDRAQALSVDQGLERKRAALERKRVALDARVAMLKAEFEVEAEEIREAIEQDEARAEAAQGDRADMARSRGARTKGER